MQLNPFHRNGIFRKTYRDKHQQAILIEGLCKMHDVLRDTPLHNKYWVCGGALLGWAREGGLLKHDNDIDFHLWESDLPAFEIASKALVRAGFKPKYYSYNCAGKIIKYVFLYKHFKVEFFVAYCVDGNTRCFLYNGKNPTYEYILETPGCELNEFEFYNRIWLKPADHESYLTIQYGNWKIPDENFNYTTSDAIVSKTAIPGKLPWIIK